MNLANIYFKSTYYGDLNLKVVMDQLLTKHADIKEISKYLETEYLPQVLTTMIMINK